MRGLRRCSFRQMGMPEPRNVGRVTGELPTLFCIYMNQIIFFIVSFGRYETLDFDNMAIINYDLYCSDLLKVRFLCPKHNRETALISPGLLDGQSFQGKVEAKCGCKYDINIVNHSWSTEMDIIGLPQENILSSHPIWWEYYTNISTESVDWITERGKIERCIKETCSLDTQCKSFIYEMLWCRIITMMDAYCHRAVTHRILSNKEKWDIFAKIKKEEKSKKEWTKEEIERMLQCSSFGSINFIVRVFKDVFGIRVVPNNQISHAVHIRNLLIHHQGIGPDGEKYTIAKEDLHDLFKSVLLFISDINKKLMEYDAEQIMPNMILPNDDKQLNQHEL